MEIILLFGGESDERLVSVASAQAVAEVLGTANLWFWHKDGPIFAVDPLELHNHEEPFTREFKPSSKPVFATISDALKAKTSDGSVFFLGLHGGLGEDGDIQSMLEKWHHHYTGSDAKASKRAFDKIATKNCLMAHNLKMAPHLLLEPDEKTARKGLIDFFEQHGETIVKPVCGGSSIGCFFVRSIPDIDSVVEQIPQFSRRFFAEKVIHGREITVGVVDHRGTLQALPCTEIVLDKNHDFDYEGKYLGHGSKEITPAQLDPKLVKEAQSIALTAHRGLSLFGYSRSDLILSNDGFYYLETNTLPGLTKQSLVPQQLLEAGVTMTDFIAGQIELARNRKF